MFMAIAARFDIELKPIPHKPCYLTSGDGILIFFYINDIVLAYRKSQEFKAKEILAKLKGHYNISNEEDLQWFLEIVIYQDRKNRLAWLSQASYIKKIVKLADTNVDVIDTDKTKDDDTPMIKAELLPYIERAMLKAIQAYQRKVGSLLYAA